MNNIIMRFPEGRLKALTLSYDDGVFQDERMIEILDKHGIKCTFNLNSVNYLQNEDNGKKFGRTRAIELYGKAIANGHEVAVHSHTHPRLEYMSTPEIVYEIMKDREILEDMFGGVVRGCAYPFGTYNDQVVDALKSCGIVYARTVGATKGFSIPTDWLRMPSTCHHAHPELDTLTDTFINTEPSPRSPAPWLFYLWGHTYEFDNNIPTNCWERIESFAEKIGGRDDIWYASNIAVYEYVEAYRSLVHSTDSKTVYNPSALKVWIQAFGKELAIEPGQTVRLV